MARIRTIKPDFWSNEQVMECSLPARLLFIGLWNFCDDAGNFSAKAKTVNAVVFPGDEEITSKQVQEWLNELASNGLVVFYKAEGRELLHVPTFTRHQRIEKPVYKYPDFPGNPPVPVCSETVPQPVADQSATVPRPIGDCSETVPQPVADQSATVKESKGKERKGKFKAVSPVCVEAVDTVKPPDAVGARCGQLARAFHEGGVQVNPGDPRLRQWVVNGLDEGIVRAAIEKAKARHPGRRFSFDYFIPMIEDWQKQADGMKAGNGLKPPKAKNDWQGFLAAEMRTIEGDVHVVEG